MKFIILFFILYVCICLNENGLGHNMKPNRNSKHGVKKNEGGEIGVLANKCIKFFRKMGKYFGIVCEIIGNLVPIHFILNIMLNIFSICISYLWLFHGFYLQVLESSRPKRMYLGAFVIVVGSLALIVIVQIIFKRRKIKKKKTYKHQL